MATIYTVLQETFNLSEFRPLQEQIIQDMINGRDLLVLMPTGGGKSLCFQLPSLLLPGITVVVSPLISLIYDQVLGLRELNISVFFLNSQTTLQEKKDLMNNLRSGSLEKAKLLYTTPETLTRNVSLMDLLKDLQDNGELSRFVVDEAHCLSNWGHEFRSSYLDLRVLKSQYPKIPVAAFTATAVPQVQMDIIKQLNLTKPKIYRQSFIRPNITYRVQARDGNSTETIEEVSHWIKDNYRNQSGIIYCLSRKKCEETALELAGLGIEADFYHAQIDPQRKEKVQRDWLSGKIHVIVATIAFALGINKADVRFVIHLAMPKSIEGYYQETGRAGRDQQPSECILYYNVKDKIILESMIKKEAKQQKSAAPVDTLVRLQDMYDYCINNVDCRKRQLSQYLGEQIDFVCDEQCDNCLQLFPTHKKSIYDTVKFILQGLIGKGSTIDSQGFKKSLLKELTSSYTRMEILRIYNHLLRYGLLERKAYLTKGDRKICEVIRIGSEYQGKTLKKLMEELNAEILHMDFPNQSKITDFFTITPRRNRRFPFIRV